ncbi:protein FAR1-RELATED SEQUENCE 5-like [Juglans regia]|uniref:Protein FAR1-RELATED SEQUENCE n=2 Tax=Juglans regia TaxID=51240 RepID=A0A6P9EQ36_JUGRE|nr:protein FAR1-RELATED SEQUENCE 5-like [Juglans regia]
MGEEEDGMAPRPSTSNSQSLMTPQNTFGDPKDYHHNFDVNMPYPPPPSNPENFRQEFSEFPQFEENVGSTFSDVAEEMLFDMDEDLEGTTVVPEDEMRVEAPRPGMEFKSDNELTAYYKQYAKQEGFGVRTQRTKRDDDGRPVYVTIGCARGGKYVSKNINISKPRATTKTDCKAKVNATLNKNEKWVITTVENVHNHITVSPKKTRLLRSHKRLDDYSQRILDLNDRAGIRMNKNYFSLVVDAGGFENLEFQERDCRNFIDKARHLRLGKGGGEALNEYFQRMRYQNDGFVSSMDVDDEGRLRNVFWADARSRAAYEYFGDVVTFDTTYLTNRYGMPFAPFVGVNHHGQSILLGAGLLSSEDTHSFVWLFRMWLACMNGRAPKAIITDQDRAMKNAISIVFPETRHRYCLWHIMRKLPEKLGSHSHFSTGLKTSIQAALYDSQTCTEFEERWGQLLDKYDLRGNNWLESLYEERTFWVPVYLKDVFWAGMSTTQRSESMNAFFDGYVHSGTTLKEFVDQFDNALRKKVEVETTADFHSSNQTIPCVSPFNFEKQFQNVYTNAKFKEFQNELIGLMCCNCTMVSKQGCISTFDVLDEISIDDCNKIVHYTLYYNEEECELKCTCALFETRGILCRHALKVFQLSRINVLPDKYVLDRWRKDEKRRYTLIKSSYDDLRASGDARRYEMVVSRCMKLATKISPSDERVNAFLRYVDDFDSKCDDATFGSRFESTNVGPNVVTDKGKKILSPHVVRGKGRPPSKRKVPPVEKMARKRKACRKILDDETQLGDTLGSQHHQFDDGVGVGTQNSIVTQSIPSENQEVFSYWLNVSLKVGLAGTSYSLLQRLGAVLPSILLLRKEKCFPLRLMLDVDMSKVMLVGSLSL